MSQTFAVRRFRATERMSTPYEVSIEADAIVDGRDRPLLGARARLVSPRINGAGRTFHGVVTSFERRGRERDGAARFGLVLEPRLATLRLTRHRRIFHDQTSVAIAQHILREHAVTHRLRLLETYPIHTHRIQADESDLAFVERILFEEGIFYFFDHPAEAVADDPDATNLGRSEVLVLCDTAQYYPRVEPDAPLVQRAFATPDAVAGDETTALSMEIVPLDPDAFDIRDAEGYDRYRRAAALLDSSLPGDAGADALIGEDLCAFEPFYSFEELEAIGGAIGIDEMVRFAIQRPRFIVATSIALAKQNADLEPGAILGAAKFHPHILVSSSTTLKRIDAATRIERPQKTINLSRPGHCGCDQMHEEIRPLLVADTNKSELLYPVHAAPPPYWGNLFSYYLVDPHITHPGREWRVIRPLEGDRPAHGYIERSGPAAVTEVTSDLTAKVPGQGDFDNIHLAPRMHLREATHVSREVLVVQGVLPRFERSWREIRATDMLHLDPIVMAPFCAHDCLHFHVRWGDHATASHVRGWARDPLLVAEIKRTGRNRLSKEMVERCRARVTLPNAEPGASMYPPWHEVQMQADSHSALLALSTIVPTLPGQREILFHSPWAYGVEFKRYHAFGVATALSVGRTGQEKFELGKRSGSGVGIDVIDPYDESAAFYWILRYKSIVRPDGSYEAREYHVVHDLEKAISL